MTRTLHTIQRAALALIMVGVGVGSTMHSVPLALGSATGGAGAGKMPAVHGAANLRPPCLPCPKVSVQAAIK